MNDRIPNYQSSHLCLLYYIQLFAEAFLFLIWSLILNDCYSIQAYFPLMLTFSDKVVEIHLHLTNNCHHYSTTMHIHIIEHSKEKIEYFLDFFFQYSQTFLHCTKGLEFLFKCVNTLLLFFLLCFGNMTYLAKRCMWVLRVQGSPFLKITGLVLTSMWWWVYWELVCMRTLSNHCHKK